MQYIPRKYLDRRSAECTLARESSLRATTMPQKLAPHQIKGDLSFWLQFSCHAMPCCLGLTALAGSDRRETPSFLLLLLLNRKVRDICPDPRTTGLRWRSKKSTVSSIESSLLRLSFPFRFAPTLLLSLQKAFVIGMKITKSNTSW